MDIHEELEMVIVDAKEKAGVDWTAMHASDTSG